MSYRLGLIASLVFIVALGGVARVDAQTERDAILNAGNAHVASWAYYTDPSSSRWYISQITAGKVDVYSLGPIVNHVAGWWTVGQGVASVNVGSNQVLVDPGLDFNSSDTFFDVGLGQWLSDPRIHSDRQRIQGSVVPIKWFFFQAPNHVWYIVNAPGYGTQTEVLRFSESNGQYDWKTTDTADLRVTFVNSGSVKLVRFDTTSSAPLVVNGHTLQGNDEKWVRFVATTIVPQFSGDRSTRINTAAVSSWWGLKEGTFSTSNPNAFSSCGANQLLGPLEICSAAAWQVGLAAVQVPNFSESTVLNTVQTLWPGRSVTDVLREVALYAGYDPTQGIGASIVASNGVLRKSWLLRHPAVGLTLVQANVTAECINGSKSWCYGTGWQQTSWYAPTKQGALQSINDLTTIFQNLAP